MTEFTVEATMQAVTDGDWSRLRSVIDLVPGTLLIEDAEEPMLVLPVQAESQGKAFLFVDGILKLVGLRPVTGSISEAPEIDFDFDDDGDENQGTDAVRAVNEWVDSVPSFDKRVTREGHVEFA
ncbi:MULTISPECIES: hypothetical protein [unclassified Modestobacter]|uniref:hypothetical protein n=1 Tax=unclassified Modestobacter TaxID=2643866 RepID=UPI0022AB3898|nr:MULTISPECIES: hypothetical protein [unclassified Modestobacter]MCZ2824185.1 hypothetical protein [Modestobacter sp. VKM Ac-2981]MCZ2854287.1 hypothetical protein [Modestobacter sp. VKM Ac-2982]